MSQAKGTMGEFLDLIRATAELDEPVRADTPLLSTGLVDSFDVVALLATFETHFGAELDVDDIDVERFDTPAQMWELVMARRG